SELLLLIRGRIGAARRHTDLDFPTAVTDVNDERMVPLIEARGIGHNHFEQVVARRCRLPGEPPGGWVQTDARGQGSGFHREIVGGASANNYEHSVVRL